MNSEMGFSLRTPPSDGGCLRDDPRGARHWRASSRRTLHMRVIGVKRALHLPNQKLLPPPSLVSGPAFWFFSNSDQLLTDVGPVGLWATR
jgi:hypothetical protein